MNEKTDLRALRGQIVYSESSNKLKICENGYLVYKANKIEGVYSILPEEYEGILVEDYGDRIIVPGFVDLHVHAPQYAFRGLGMDMELLPAKNLWRDCMGTGIMSKIRILWRCI